MPDNPSVTPPVVAGELSPDGRFRWDGGRWVYTTAVPGAGSPPALMVSPKAQLKAWSANIQLRNVILRYGVTTFAIGVGLSLVLALVAIVGLLASASYALQSILGPSAASFGAVPSQGSDSPFRADVLAGAVVAIVGFFFFQSNLTLSGATSGVIATSVFGFGSLTITALIVQRAFAFGRRLALTFPDDSLSPSGLAVRSSLIAVPYWAGAIILYILSSYRVGYQGQTIATFGPNAIGLVAPALVVALPAALGGALASRTPRGLFAQEVARGAMLGGLSMVTAGLFSLIGGIVAFGLAYATSASSNPLLHNQPTTLPEGSPDGSRAGGRPALGLVVVLTGIVLLTFYVGNLLALAWGNSVSLRFFASAGAWGLIPLVFGAAGGLIPALHLRRTPSHVERASFAFTVALGTAGLAFLTTLTLGSYSTGPDLGPTLVGSLAVGIALAAFGPRAAEMPYFLLLTNNPIGRWVGRVVAANDPESDGSTQPGADLKVPAMDGRNTSTQSVPTRSMTNPIRLKMGTKTKVGLAALAALVALGIAGNAVASNATSPGAFATEYVRAVGQNNVEQVWQANKLLPVQPNQYGLDGQVLRLDSKEDFASMMKLPPNRHSARDNIQVTHLATVGDSTFVSLSYREAGEQRSTSLVLQKSPEKRYLFYPDWQVVVTPSLLAWLPPSADAKILIDGRPTSGRAALTLPGYHKLTLMGGGLFADSTQVVPAAQSLAQPVRFPLTLTAQATTAAEKAVNAYFTNCAARSAAAPSGCPQSVIDWTPINVRWTLVGDPSSQMQVDIEADPGSLQARGVPQVVAHGHYLMTVVFDGTGGTKHRFSGGPYALALQWDGSKFAASEAQGFYQPTKPLARPNVSDDLVKSAVADAFAACARIKAVSGAPNCPMTFASWDVVSNPQWELVGNQLQGATVGFDEATGVLTVTGSYKMKLNYSTESSKAKSANTEGNYIAYVVWDGKNATAVYIR